MGTQSAQFLNSDSGFYRQSAARLHSGAAAIAEVSAQQGYGGRRSAPAASTIHLLVEIGLRTRQATLRRPAVPLHRGIENMGELFEASDSLATELLALIDLSTIDTGRVQISDTDGSFALEHCHALRSRLQLRLLPSALVVHRAQFVALMRSLWLTHIRRT